MLQNISTAARPMLFHCTYKEGLSSQAK